jgi:uncharacterized protein (TIGR00299 family) protein
MRIAYFDCFAGVSGDMILGALVDAGAPLATLQKAMASLPLPGLGLRAERVRRQGLAATKVTVLTGEPSPPLRHLSDLERLVAEGELSPRVREMALAVFRRLAEAEARVHGSSPDHVHFHEIGAADTVADVIGAAVGLEALGVARIVASPLPASPGWIKGEHGPLPLPAPATLELMRGLPTRPLAPSSTGESERVTPTGAAILGAWAESWGLIPEMIPAAIGYGAGGRDDPDIPNLLRVIVGENAEAPHPERLALLETNIDDMSPQLFAPTMERLLKAGALDVYLTPIIMKKGRPATLVSVLAPLPAVDDLAQILYEETTTIGVRWHEVARRALPRRWETVETEFGRARVKLAAWKPGEWKAMPEYDDCVTLAEAAGAPVRVVQAAVMAAAQTLIRPEKKEVR